MLRKIKYIFLTVVVCLGFNLAFASDSITNQAQNLPFYPQYPVVNYGTGAHADLVKRGEYLVKLGDCISCHTNTIDPNAKPFSGGLAINTPFGVFYTPNLTPDKATGIGSWSDA